MARSRSTLGKLQRDQAKRAKAKAKQEDRLARREDRGTTDQAPVQPAEDQSALLEQFARLHDDLADGRISLEEFEQRQEELRGRLQVD
jgi:hypothetical protein